MQYNIIEWQIIIPKYLTKYTVVDYLITKKDSLFWGSQTGYIYGLSGIFALKNLVWESGVGGLWRSALLAFGQDTNMRPLFILFSLVGEARKKRKPRGPRDVIFCLEPRVYSF